VSAAPWTLNTDGAARGNPGPAGAGCVLANPAGEVVATVAEGLGTLTNNEAEYRALLLGLALAERHQVRELEVRMDSELIIRQLKGEYKVKAEHLKAFHADARARIAKLERCVLRHVRREQNSEADLLANAGIDNS
jgi:ribonuclease HI